MLSLNLTKSTATALFADLEQERKAHNTFFWPKGSTIGGRILRNHDVVCRVKKKENNNEEKEDKPGFCYEFVDTSKRINGRSKNRVYRIAGTLSQDKFKPCGKRGKTGIPRQRLIKYQKITDEDPLSLIINEYQSASKAGMPGIKRPTVVEDTAFLTMRKLPGHNLENFLYGSASRPGAKLNYLQRFQICLALLEALDQQVAQHKLIHRDIKPDNILIEFHPDKPPRIHIIDFGFSIDADHLDGICPGSIAHAAPECLRGEWFLQSATTDVFSMAIVLLQTLNFPNEVLLNSFDARRMGKPFDLRLHLGELLKNASGISREFKREVRKLIRDMLDPIAERRPSACEAAQRMRMLEPIVALSQSAASSSEGEPILLPPSRILAPPSKPRVVRRRFFSQRIVTQCPSSDDDEPALTSGGMSCSGII